MTRSAGRPDALIKPECGFSKTFRLTSGFFGLFY